MSVKGSNFSGIYADSYDLMYSHLDALNEFNQAEDFCREFVEKPHTVLDIGGGTGRFTQLFIDKYPQVILVEPSKCMAKIAASKFEDEKKLTILRKSAQNFSLPQKADGAYMMFSVASYFSTPRTFKAALRNIAANLNPNSYIYFDVWNYDASKKRKFTQTVKTFNHKNQVIERTVTLNQSKVQEMDIGFYTLELTIFFQNLATKQIHIENHKLAEVSEMWIHSLLSQTPEIADFKTRKNPNKDGNLEVCIALH